MKTEAVGKITFVRFVDDTMGGPYMPTVVVIHADHAGEMHITDSFHGAFACLNPGPKHKCFKMSDLNLSREEMLFLWSKFPDKKRRIA